MFECILKEIFIVFIIVFIIIIVQLISATVIIICAIISSKWGFLICWFLHILFYLCNSLSPISI